MSKMKTVKKFMPSFAAEIPQFALVADLVVHLSLGQEIVTQGLKLKCVANARLFLPTNHSVSG